MTAFFHGLQLLLALAELIDNSFADRSLLADLHR